MVSRFRVIVATAMLASSCAKPLLKLPSGPDVPATDTAAVLAEATAACRVVTAISAEIGVSGSVGGQRLRARLLAGAASPASARLEAVAPAGQPVFIFVANGDDATLLLPRDDRVLEHGRPVDVLEAIAGIPLDAAALRQTLVGCAVAPDRDGGRKPADDWRVVADGGAEHYLQRLRQPDAWRLVATVYPPSASGGWRAEYSDFEGGLPRTVHLVSADRKRFDLTLKLSQVALNETLGPEVFRVQVPRTADPITIEELRNARPGVRQD